MRREKVVYIISDIDKALAFEWIAEYVQKDKFAISFILLNPYVSKLEAYLESNGFEVIRIQCRGKKDWPFAIIKTYKQLRKLQPNIVHCHLIQATIIGLIAAKLAGIKKRIYTRHHSSLHHIYFPKGVWWDKLSNKLATCIVAISSVVRKVLIEWENVPSDKVVLIHHGFLLNTFTNINPERIEGCRKRHSIEKGRFVVGVISRFTEWKGVHYIVPAFKKYFEFNSNALLVLFNARGDYEKPIKSALETLPPDSFRLIDFETDVAAAYRTMDVFVHVPVDEHSEAFGQVYVEALASEIPSVFTLSGIAGDFIKNEQNSMVVPFKDSEAIYEALKKLASDRTLQGRLKINGKKDIERLFALENMITALENLYEK